MKKLLLSSLILTSIVALAYTQIDVDNATYLAGKGIITTQSTTAGYRLDDTITRAEVAGIALKLKGINLPENYQCRKYFSDVTKNDWICRAVEIAADARFISRTNTTFRPQDKITKVEALAILMKAGDISTSPTEEQKISIQFYRLLFENDISWQQNTIMAAMFHKIINNVTLDTLESGPEGVTGNSTTLKVIFNANKSATRAEIFAFAKNILEYRATMSGEIMMDSQNRTIEK